MVNLVMRSLNEVIKELPRVIKAKYHNYEALLQVKQSRFVYVKLFLLKKTKDLDLNKLVEVLDSCTKEELGSKVTYAIITTSLLPPFISCITSILYFWKIAEEKQSKIKIKKKPLLLLSIMLTKRQVKELIEIIENAFSNEEQVYLILTTLCNKQKQCYINLDSTRTCIENKNIGIDEVRERDLGTNIIFERNHLRSFSIGVEDIDYIDKIMMTQITEFITKHYS